MLETCGFLKYKNSAKKLNDVDLNLDHKVLWGKKRHKLSGGKIKNIREQLYGFN